MKQHVEIKFHIELDEENTEAVRQLSDEGVTEVLEAQREGLKEMVESEIPDGCKVTFETVETRLEDE